MLFIWAGLIYLREGFLGFNLRQIISRRGNMLAFLGFIEQAAKTLVGVFLKIR
jgi:hypothetical protein